MGHASNALIIRTSKLLDEINFNKDYNPIEIYGDFKEFKSDYNKQKLPSYQNT